MRNGIWQQLGTGSRKSGLKRGVDRAGDSMLGGRRLGLVLGILETSPGHSVEWKHMVSMCVSSATLRVCPQFCICNSGVTYGKCRNRNKNSFCMCIWDGNPKISQFAPFLHSSAPQQPPCACEFMGNNGWDPVNLKTLNYLRRAWRNQQLQKLYWELQTSREQLHGGVALQWFRPEGRTQQEL